MSAKNVNSLVGATTRYIAGRNAMQTVYWRTMPGTDGRMVKIHKNCEFDKVQNLPAKIRMQYYNKNFWTSTDGAH
ncbi:uncharacterized protein LOC126762641 [Bactrocera neohumeralis]|uniref:Uncharacterized protein LOC109579995 n=1 Tax=Bactrocera dorsalis TaxID=27457 RepID=A0A6J0RKU2_BACDO|nr:uncharacterized protein LOC109579995 [Bactrocera dorsalis]XP_039966829.1 uncharacterized protein LOC120778862 [Bactrocera tryoni]XP_050335486.1 uncharacterized protein LOC126762641 [Bactrocera neohumeralis]XP_050335487.1 uncharacterized protein LOC126762641 [Bactrocera neohumeralis]